jgi:hypothetical protein
MTNNNVYLDLQMCNISSQNQVINFNETRFIDIVSEPNKYELSIGRFQVSTSTLPVFIPVIKPLSDNSHETIYSVSLEYKGYTVTTKVYWVPEITNVNEPSPPSSNSNGLQSKSDYYYAFSYSWLPKLIETALQIAFDDLKQAVLEGEGDDLLAECQIPYFYFDTISGSSILSVDSDFFDSYKNEDHVKINFNQSLYNLFSSFNSTFNGISFEIIVDSFRGSDTQKINASVNENYSNVLQEYSTIASQNPVSSILFTSATLPIVSENINTPITFTDSSTSGGANLSSDTKRIITDLQSESLIYKPSLTMIPSAQFRYISMTNANAIRDIQISCLWRDLLGNFHDLLLPSVGSCSVKLYFRRID